MGQRRVAREATITILYLMDIGGLPLKEASLSFWRENDAPKSVKEFANLLTEGTKNNLSKIDKLISQHAQNWELKRMASIDRTILRMATFELINQLDTPANVIIDEAIEIAKKYSTAESGKFVNGILDKIKEEVRKK
ncbi:MAG TPA: transcription antitermination factor NusB [Elusimicrobia bacterium]|jgi:N utilization substance protein B|nr:transcription antitermination factor NusB [Elusimicrobiota bacterium]